MHPAVALPLDAEASRSGLSSDQDDSISSSSDSPAPVDNEESDFSSGNNDSQSSIGVGNFQDMHVEDRWWPPINCLPNEILISVFAKLSAPSDLYHCTLVCKRWTRNAVELLWHRPACTNWDSHTSICLTLQAPKPFFQYRDFIKRLNLAALAEKISDGSVTPLYACTRIERLTLTNCLGLTDAGIIGLVQNNTNLLALDVSNGKNITDQSIAVIAEYCKRMQGLNISGCDGISNDSLVTLAKSCKYIKRLKLNECTQIRDNAVHAFAENCPNILEIDLNMCANIGSGAVTALMAKGSCLRELRLAFCSLVADQAFLSLPPNQMLSHLRILDLTSCSHITDAGIRKIVDAAPRLRNLVLAKCRLLTDASLTAIAKLGKNLHYVHLGHCSNITDDGVKTLVSHCNRMRYIDLGCCANLTDESVKRLAVLPKLKRIGLVKCVSITDESIFTLASLATRPRVRRDANGLYVGGGEYYTSNLERVHLSYCVNLTLKSILKLLNSCPRLSHLSLTGVPAFQRDEFNSFCREAPLEFTDHQRDVFCVFSGIQVSRFRDFLNKAPQFESLRENGSPRPHPRNRQGSNRNAPATSNAMPTTFEEAAYEDEIGDDDNDFEGMYANDMMQNAQPGNGYTGNGMQQGQTFSGHGFLGQGFLGQSFPGQSSQGHENLSSMTHSLPNFAMAPSLPWQAPDVSAVHGNGFPVGNFATQQTALPLNHTLQIPLPSLSSFFNDNENGQEIPLPSLSSFFNDTENGQAPLNFYGMPQASMAGPAQTGGRQASTASAATAMGASTAQMHQADVDEQDNLNG